ncbi:hypothetical protein OKW21_004272 [Catalinimonas alkaloidigena]|nr:hypothetical protein [Catalinimonas alkaloidigena]
MLCLGVKGIETKYSKKNGLSKLGLFPVKLVSYSRLRGGGFYRTVGAIGKFGKLDISQAWLPVSSCDMPDPMSCEG